MKSSLESIPQELQAVPHWVRWRAVWNSEKQRNDKLPFQLYSEFKASSNQVTGWGTFKNAMRLSEGYSGVGFQAGVKPCGNILIDLDHCLANDGSIQPWARTIVDFANSYTEISPSGDGLHIFCGGKLPGPGKAAAKLPSVGSKAGEACIYDFGRYFTVTGEVFEGRKAYRTLPQNEVSQLYGLISDLKGEQELGPEQKSGPLEFDDLDLEIVKNSILQDEKTASLFSGEWQDLFPSQSEADLSLMSSLAFYSKGNTEIMEQLFRESGLFRPEGKGADYLDRTITRALQRSTQANKVFNIPDIVNLSEYKGSIPKLDPVLIHGVLREKSKLLLAGHSKAFKSYSMMRLGLSLAHGAEFLGFPCEKCRVLYVNLELKPGTFFHRVSEIAQAAGMGAHKGNFDVLHLRAVGFYLEDLIPAIVEKCKARGYKVIIFDPLYKLYRCRAIKAFSENASSDMAYVSGLLDELMQKTSSSIFVVHHFGKGSQAGKSAIDRGAGSGLLGRDYDALLSLTELEEKECYELEFVLREFKSPEALKLRWSYPLHTADSSLANVQIKGTKETPSSKSENEKIKALDALGFAPMKFTDIVKAIIKASGKSERTARSWLGQYEIMGRIRKNQDGTYQQPQEIDLAEGV